MKEIYKILKYAVLFFIIYINLLLSYIIYILPDDPQTNTDTPVSITKIHLTKATDQFYNQLPQGSFILEKDCHLQNDHCFDTYQCRNLDKLKVFIYPHFSKGHFSRQFQEYIETIYSSDYYEPDPGKACLFIPPIDLLNEDSLDKNKTAKELFGLPYWSFGRNHFILNMKSSDEALGSKLQLPYHSAIITSSTFESHIYRNGFDIAVPQFNQITSQLATKSFLNKDKKFKIISTQPHLTRSLKSSLHKLESERQISIIFESDLNTDLYARSVFCMVILHEYNLGHTAETALFNALKFNCIPVIVSQDWILPFNEFLDWKLFSIQLRIFELENVYEIIDNYSESDIETMKKQIKFVFKRYFSSMKSITLGVLMALEAKIYPNSAISYELANFERTFPKNPFLIPYRFKKSGFTAVIIVKHPSNKLIEFVEKILTKCPSLHTIEILWFNRMGKQIITFFQEQKYYNLLTGDNIPVNINLMSIKKIHTIFYPFSGYKNAGPILLVGPDFQKFRSEKIERAYEFWLNNPNQFVTVGTKLDRLFFYHSIYNSYFCDRPSRFNGEMNFNQEVKLMQAMVFNLTGKGVIKLEDQF